MVFLGRAPEPRTVSVIKNSNTAITGVAGTYSLKDVGRSITGTAIPAGTTLYAVASDTAATLSAAATASTTNAAVIGSDQSRVVTVTKNSNTAITGVAGTFSTKDVGRPIVGTGIPAAAILTAVASDVAATLSAAATTSTVDSAVIGSAATYVADSLAYGFAGWSPETEAESLTYSVAAFNAGLTAPTVADNHSPVVQRSRG